MNRPNATINEHPERDRTQQPHFPPEDGLDLEVTDVACETEGLAAGERVFFVAGDDDGAGEEEPGIDFNVLAEESGSVAEVVGEMAAEKEEPAAEPLAEEDLFEVGVRFETGRADAEAVMAEAADAPEAVPEVVSAAPLAVAGDSSSGEYLPASPVSDAVPAAIPDALPNAVSNVVPDTPRAQRSRERARRKKEKRAAKAAARANKLPEIVLARSEGTDTLLPEKGAVAAAIAEAACEAAMPEAAKFEPARLEAAIFEPNALADALELAESAPAVPAAPAEPALRAPVRSLITPIDIISEQTDIVSDSAEETVEPEGAVPAPVPDAEAEAEAAGPDAMSGAKQAYDRVLLLSAAGELRQDAYRLLDDAGSGEDAENAAPAEETGMNNVILFRPAFMEQEPEDAEDSLNSAEPAEAFAPPRLRLLPRVEDADENDAAGGVDGAATVAAVAPPPPSGAEPALSPLERLALLRAIAGSPTEDADAGFDVTAVADAMDDAANEAAAVSDENVILSRELYEEPLDLQAELARARTEIAAEITSSMAASMERDLQARSDEFALRLLEAQAAAAESEARARAGTAELLEKEKQAAAAAAETEKEVAGLNAEMARLAEELKNRGERLAALDKEIAGQGARLSRFDGLQDEHEKLYAQFEDLRTAYNEIVTSAMPGLQAERDDFALTVERQVDEMDSLKSSLSGARRRLAVGYSMAAAACIMIVSLPVAGWLRSGADERAAARDRQEVAELRDRADEAERQTLAAGETIVELERKLNLAVVELAKLETRNGEISRRGREFAGKAVPAIPGGGTPTRTSTMALQATPAPGGALRVNEVRDPAGSIEQVYADNRTRREQAEGPQMAAASARPAPASAPAGRIPVSAVARADSSAKPSGSSLRPAADSTDRAAVAGRTAAVRAGEGVAQVVYRVMGTRDPEVINWVIRENGIKTDRRGNPRIYPEQQLRLPGRMEQTASR